MTQGPSGAGAGEQPTAAFRDAPGRVWLIRLCVATVMAVAILDWIGWAIGSTLLTRLAPTWVVLTPWASAMLFLLAAAAHAQTPEATSAHTRGRVLAAAAGLIAFLMLVEYATGSSWGFDTWWFGDAVTHVGSAHPGRPAPATVVAVVSMALALLQLRSDRHHAEFFSQVFTALAMFPAFVRLVGYAAGATGIFEFDTSTGMAFVTALCMLLIGVAAFAVRPDRRPMALLTARPDRVSITRLLLVFLALPLLLLLGAQALSDLGAPDRVAIVLSDLFAALVVGTAVFAVSSEQQRSLLRQAALTEALRASEQRYRLLAENGSDVIITGPPYGRIDWVSDSVERTLGWRPSELIGEHGVDLIHPEDRPSVESALLRVAAGKPQRMEARWRRSDGEYLWMSGLIGPEWDPSGRVLGRIANWRDIAAEHSAREDLAAERELLAVNMQALLDPLVLFKAVRDEDGAITDFEYIDLNDAACVYVGDTREQLIGQHVGKLRPAVRASGLFELYVKAMVSGEKLAVDDFPVADVHGAMRFLDIRGRRVPGDRLSVTWRNVTERRESAVAIAASEEHYRLLAENTADVVFRLRDGIISWISPSVTDALGDDVDAWIGRDVTVIMHPDDLSVYMEGLVRVRQGETVVSRVRVLDNHGVFHWIEAHAKQYHNPEGVVDGAICSMRLVDAEVAAEQVLDRLARFDDLTGLLNRGEALRRLAYATSTLRTPGEHTAVLFCDVDHFKQVNDTLGHAAGDEVLRTLAQRTRDCVRTSDIVARMGGDEIMVVLQGLADPDSALLVAEKLRASAAEPISTPDGVVHCSMSIGVTTVADGEGPDALIARADAAMYEAKSTGRNRVIRVL